MPDPGTSLTALSNSLIHASPLASEGIRQSPRGDKEPPAMTFGPFGKAERLNC